MKKKSFIKKALLWSAVVLLLLIIAFGIYVSDYYHADEMAIQAFSASENVVQTSLEDGSIVFSSSNPSSGMIFYPGGKVEHTAYIPLMRALAEKGVLCILVKMPFRLAVFDIHAAKGIQEAYPDITEWYIGGHSLGGTMAGYYLEDHFSEFEALILLGSYTTVDLSKTNLRMLSLYGSNDKVLDRNKYEENKKNLPSDLTEVVLEGGCHAYFGMYGSQKGDGTPTISNTEQIRLSATHIFNFIQKGK